ncbi:hypothetical protein EVAR_10593_1 [Eumeta japonica]|uniref:Uncharacterized protein n=1 Tax=Eumeta variegata TaxID=151549 RepID=A0A4C1U242_EUMVA|nr:hypothetical protein EVAR_10593_1 [Eumeta japonica]
MSETDDCLCSIFQGIFWNNKGPFGSSYNLKVTYRTLDSESEFVKVKIHFKSESLLEAHANITPTYIHTSIPIFQKRFCRFRCGTEKKIKSQSAPRVGFVFPAVKRRNTFAPAGSRKLCCLINMSGGTLVTASKCPSPDTYLNVHLCTGLITNSTLAGVACFDVTRQSSCHVGADAAFTASNEKLPPRVPSRLMRVFIYCVVIVNVQSIVKSITVTGSSS